MKEFADDDTMTESQQVAISAQTKKSYIFNSSIYQFLSNMYIVLFIFCMNTQTIGDVGKKSVLTEPPLAVPEQRKGGDECDLGDILTELRNDYRS